MVSRNKRLTISLPEHVWDRLEADAQKDGVTLATAWRRRMLAHHDGLHPTPSGPLTDEETAALKAWNASVRHGEKITASAWRARTDPILRARGHDLPPLPGKVGRDGDTDSLLAWVHVVHPLLPGDHPTPPRYRGKKVKRGATSSAEQECIEQDGCSKGAHADECPVPSAPKRRPTRAEELYDDLDRDSDVTHHAVG